MRCRTQFYWKLPSVIRSLITVKKPSMSRVNVLSALDDTCETLQHFCSVKRLSEADWQTHIGT